MKDLYNLHNFYNVETNGKSSKKLNNRGKSFGYQVLGFGSGGVAEILFSANQLGLFGFGAPASGYVSTTNLVSTSGVVASDTAGVGTGRTSPSGCSYGEDKGIVAYGYTSGAYQNISNLVSNVGVVATDTTSIAGTARYKLAATTFGGDKGIFGYGMTYPTDLGMTNIVSNVGVVASDVSVVGTPRTALAATGYGSNRQTAIFGYGNEDNGTYLSMTNLVSSVGVVAADVSGVGTARHGLAAARYGDDKGIFGYGTAGYNISLTNLVSSVGVIASDTTGVGTARHWTSACGYGGDKCVFAYGTVVYPSNLSNKVSNVGVVATDTAGVGTARANLAALSYSI